MNIPENIKIGGFDITVVFVENLLTDRNSLGEYHPRMQGIKIDKDTTRQQKQETFIHEVLEVIASIYNIDIEHKDLSIMGTVLHQVILDNREIFRQ